MCKVTVLMSTYNGEKYLKEQLDSIISQDGVAVHLLIRDDGSTDSTADILSEYSARYSNVKFLLGRNLGYANSFLSLCSVASDSEYYAFSDQDDIWDKDKLAVAVSKIGGGITFIAAI